MSHWLCELGSADSPTFSALANEQLEPTPLYDAVVDAVTKPGDGEHETDPPLVMPARPSFPDAGAVECLICRREGPVEAAVRHGDGWVGRCCSTANFPNGYQAPSERSPQ